MTRGKHGYKYQKLCHNPSPLPQGREGSLTAKSPNLSAKNVIRPNRTHSFLNLQTKFFKLRFVLWQISSELSKICSIRPHTPRIMQNSHQLLTHLYYIMFQAPAPAEELSGIPENYADSAQFTHIVCELRKIHTIC